MRGWCRSAPFNQTANNIFYHDWNLHKSRLIVLLNRIVIRFTEKASKDCYFDWKREKSGIVEWQQVMFTCLPDYWLEVSDIFAP